MKKIKTYEIRHEIGIKATSKLVYQALTDIKMLSNWWTSDTRGTSKVGNFLEFWFVDFCQKFEVIELKQNQFVHWKCADKGLEDWEETEIRFSLRSDEKQCFVNFIHSGWQDNTGLYPHCSTKWAVFLLSLKEFLETGRGRPFPHDLAVNHN
ncbi:SRPBCC family protein [Fluviispira multicolorata]|uniref:SRPBCC domain-containing protein n=1 Tax=Fluviispira multicolorata TaxID=2654512 RepID=A0A833N2V9_9BACT|nr:SRPBCC domain-containing protein [Fluviispira multicolorata]KAB8033323.1 SRPBCC domain-containing protein [Fluviispira multicolorata]